MSSASGVLQRQCACGQHTVAGGECEACRKQREGTLQRAAISAPPVGDVPSIVYKVLRAPGQPLDAATRAFMEPRFGHDFSGVDVHANGSMPVPARLSIGNTHDAFEQAAEMMAQRVMNRSVTSTSTGYDLSGVRIHTDAKAAESARAVNALAYTVGQDIVFAEGQYHPNTSAGATLIAHELTHVIQQSGASEMAAKPSANERHGVPHTPPITGVIARQPDPDGHGWTDAPDKNKTATMVDKDGKIVNVFDKDANLISSKVINEGVWRIPVENLSHGFQDDDKGPSKKPITSESAKGKAVALIPNMVRQIVLAQSKKVSAKDKVLVDVLLHLHGMGIGYRQLEEGAQDYAGVLKEQEVRDVDLYQMEQQLQSHVKTNNKLLIAVLPQGSQGSNFRDLSSESGNYLDDVFRKLKDKHFLPENAERGRVILSAHSGAGPRAMQIANRPAQAGNRTDVLLFDAINSSCEKEEQKQDGKTVLNKKTENPIMVCKEPKVCASNEYGTVRKWVKNKINEDMRKVKEQPEARQVATLQTDGTRFRGITSEPLNTKNTCSYGYWYNKLNGDIDSEIKAQKATPAVDKQLRQNYWVHPAQGTSGHEHVMGKSNLEEALKD